MAYSEDERNQKLLKIFDIISNGQSLRKALEQVKMSSATFFEWIDNDADKAKQYARACEDRADMIFEEILEIADKQDSDVIEIDGNIVTNHNVINRSRLQVDARKWALSKMNPKKYGDKLDITSDNTRLNIPLIPDIGNR